MVEPAVKVTVPEDERVIMVGWVVEVPISEVEEKEYIIHHQYVKLVYLFMY